MSTRLPLLPITVGLLASSSLAMAQDGAYQAPPAPLQAIDTQDDARIRQAVDQMESLGDRAKRACGTASSVTPEMKSAVLKVHDELSDLKHQLH